MTPPPFKGPLRWRRTLPLPALLIGLALCCGVGPTQAASSAASSALEGLSTSVGVFSNAVSGLSSSASSGRNKVAQGEYRIEQTRTAAGAPALTEIDLQPTDPTVTAAAPWTLRLPAEVVAAQGLEPGQRIAVRERAYGFALWRAQGREPFYLVVHDEWAQALESRALHEEWPSGSRR